MARFVVPVRGRFTWATACLAGALSALSYPPPVMAQLPQARLTSLSRCGVRSGETAEVTLRGTDLEGTSTLWFDHPGLRAAHVKDLTFRVSCAPEVPLGHHDIRAVGTFGATNPRAFIVGDRPEQAEAEPNDLPAQATPVFVNAVVNGELSAPTQVDYLSLQGKKGQRLFLDLEAERIDSRLDATIRVLTPAGKEISESRDVFGADPFLDLTLPADGTYLIKIHDSIYAGSPDHFYRLKIHDGPHFDALLPRASAPGQGGDFTVFGRGLGGETRDGGPLRIDGAAVEKRRVSIFPGDVRAVRLDGLRGYVPSSAGLFGGGFDYVMVRPSRSGAAPVCAGPVMIAIADEPIVLDKEPNDEDAQAQVVTVPCDISGAFSAPGDVDLYRFQARKGEVWKLEAIAERQGSPADPVLLVQKVNSKGSAEDLSSGDDVDDAGIGVRFNTQSVDAEVRLPIPDDGTYQVQVSDLYGSQRGDPRLTYRLVIRREQPDFRVLLIPASTTTTDGVTLRAGGRASACAAVQRRDGFAGAIRVEARELPPGVRCEPVVIGPGQVVAPIVFEAADNAATTHGVVSFVARARFGDRKDELSYTPGAGTLSEDLIHPVLAGGMIWPPAANPAVTPARLFRGFVVAVHGEPSPLTLSARPESVVVAQGRQIELDLAVIRREGFVEAVAASTADLPPNVPATSATIPKEAKAGTLPVFFPRNVPPGTYSFVVRGAGPYPFNKDPKAKEKPNITLSEPSNPITVTVRPAPLHLTVDNKGGNLKPGQQLEVEATITRQEGFTGSASLTLNAPKSARLSAPPVTIAAGQSKAKLMIKAASDTPMGAVASATIRASQTVRGESIVVDEQLALTVSK